MQVDLRFWGVVVKPGETVKCDPGELYYHLSQIALEAGKAGENVEVFVKTDDKRITLCTLSVDNDPHSVTGLVFNKKFELLHSSMNSNICFTGYNFKIVERSNTSTKGDDESDEEVPLLVPLDSNTNATHGANKLTAPRPVDAPSSTPKATVEEPTTPGMSKGDDKDRTDAQNPSDGDDSESSEDVDYPRKKTKSEKRPVETPLKTPQGKKAKIETPTTDKKTGYVHVATPYPAKQARKLSDYVHVATPYPAKHARKAPESKDKSKQSTPHFCAPCSRFFTSPAGLRDHSKAKHAATD